MIMLDITEICTGKSLSDVVVTFLFSLALYLVLFTAIFFGKHFWDSFKQLKK